MIQERDIRLYETGSGGDFQAEGNKLKGCFSFENFPYLAMFGGNPGFLTGETVDDQQNFDYWGNSLFWSDNLDVQFNSRTEHVLNTVALNSRGRKLIQEAVESDLSFMSPFADVSVEVSLLGVNKVGIDILINEPENGVERRFMYIWDGAQLIDESTAPLNKPVEGEGLQEVLQFALG